MPRFNLVDEPWIPCAEPAGGSPRFLSLREVFAEAPLLSNITDPSPAVTISLYRLLIAILHRSLNGPCSVAEWQSAWEDNCWDVNRIHAYLQRWHARFDLFDTHQPFYQTPGLDPRSVPPATQLTHERASDRNRALLFDHSPDDAGLSPAEAARYLVAMQNFAVGGLIGLGQGEPLANKFASASPLLGGAVVLVHGDSLFRTLMLNWVRYNRDDEVPFAFGGDDMPAWEREGGAQPQDRLPHGYVDLLTWQSRRILLITNSSAASPVTTVRVQGVVLMKGYQFADSFEQWGAETMVAFRKNTNSKKGPPWFPIGLNPDRVVWRDSQALFQSVADRWQRPKVMDWLETLVSRGALVDDHLVVPLEVYGLIPEQANIRDWRHETLPLPLRLLEERQAAARQLHERLRQAISLAEDVAQLFDAGWVPLPSREKPLPSPMWTLCKALLASRSEREPGREPRREDCVALARSFGAGPRYWSRLDTPFRQFVNQLTDPTDVVEEGGTTRYGMRALRAWATKVERIAQAVFGVILQDLSDSGRGLQASAPADQHFRYLLAALLAHSRGEPAGDLVAADK